MKKFYTFPILIFLSFQSFAQLLPVMETSPNQLPPRAERQPFRPSDIRTTTCANDTAQYPFTKTTNARLISVDGTLVRAVYQWYDAPEPVSVEGAFFYAYGINDTMTLSIQIYNAGTDSLPVGAPLRSASVFIPQGAPTGPTIAGARKVARFLPPVTVSGPYCLVIGNLGTDSAGIYTNDFIADAGQSEWLAGININGFWTHGYAINFTTGDNLNGDILLMPIVSYDYDGMASSPDTCDLQPDPNTFTGQSSPITMSRFYNEEVARGNANQTWFWDYDDGSTGIGQNVTHVFKDRGDQEVKMITRMGYTKVCHDTSFVFINGVPDGNIDFTENGNMVDFTTNSTNVDSWLWDFGDGNVSPQANPSHFYTNFGTFDVSVTLSNDCDTLTLNREISFCPDLDANFGWEIGDSTILTVAFSDSTTGANGWFWDFGNGQISTSQNPSITFAAPGTYPVILYVKNACGEGDSTLLNVSVWRTSVDNLLSPSTIRLAPNPASTAVYALIDGHIGEHLVYELYDYTSRLLSVQDHGRLQTDRIPLNLPAIPTGSYWIRLRLDDAYSMEKLIWNEN